MVFFFDESFHSRKINKQTIEDKEFFDNYVMTGIGCLRKDLYKNEILYKQFEEKFKEKFECYEYDLIKRDGRRPGEFKEQENIDIDLSRSSGKIVAEEDILR